MKGTIVEVDGVPNLGPMIVANAGAAALFGVIIGVVTRFTQNTLIMLGIAVVYAVIMNRWVAKTVPKPPMAQHRKGSFKPVKGGGWKVVRWTATVMFTALGVQLVSFVALYALVMSL